MQIRIKDGKVTATLSARETVALETTITVLQFLARNDLISVKSYSTLVEELGARGIFSPPPIGNATKQQVFDLKEPEAADGEVAKARV